MGFQFVLLDINLTTEEISTCELPFHLIKEYIGGRGLGGKLLLDLVPPGADPLGEENALIWLNGILSGTMIPGSSKHAVITKSPVSGAYCDSYSSGGVGFNMVYSGYHGMILRGKAKKPSYIYIKDETVEIRDASHLWGMYSFAASEKLLAELGGEGWGHAMIGPAGENMVYYAGINNDYFRQAARGGVGAVMGSKNIKAVVAKGSGGVPCLDVEGFMKLHQERLAAAKVNPAAEHHKEAGTSVTLDVTAAAGMLPTRNFQTGVCTDSLGELDSEGYKKKATGSVACLACPVPCGKILKCQQIDGKDFRIEGPEYETACLLGTNLDIVDLNFVSEANMLCDNLGMDTISAGNIIGFIMELTQRGLIPEEFKDQAIAFGDKEGALRVMEDLAYSRGIGALAKGGVRALARAIGRDSEDFAMQSKGLEFPAYDPRRGFGTALSYAVTPRGACHRRAWPPGREVLGGFPPYEFKEKGQLIKDQFDERNVLHSLIACDFNFFAVPVSVDQYMEYTRLVTGIDFSKEELAMAVDRIESTIRYFNYLQGLTRKDDTMPKRVLEEPMPEGPAQGKMVTKEGFDDMLDQYYALRGWDSNGTPNPETLAKYGIQSGGGKICG